MSSPILNPNQMKKTDIRFEDKSLINIGDIPVIISKISKRFILKHEHYSTQTVYLDTPELLYLNAKLSGEFNKLKIRLRTYNGLDETNLELKYKNGTLGYKRLKMFQSMDEAKTFIKINSNKKLIETVEVFYHREGFNILDPTNKQKIRVTIDTNISFRKNNINKRINDSVLEIKYSKNSSYIKDLKSDLNFLKTSFSKYEKGFKCL